METKYTVYHPDGRVVPGVTNWPARPEWHHMRKLLTDAVGGHPEHVSVFPGGLIKDMFVHEEGHYLGLPYNKNASEIYHAAWRINNPGQEPPENTPVIVGPAILFGRRVWF